MDLEMTGLDPDRNVIVEIATLITDDDLAVIAEGPDIVVQATEEDLAAMDEVVTAMHTRSGLLEAIRKSETDLAEAGRQTLDFLRAHIPEAGTVPLCGNSIGMDRRFLARWLPEIDRFLHYRSIDVSTLKELTRRWYPQVHNGQPRKVGSHRAMGDVHESVAELAYYRKTVFRASTGADAARLPG
jgi:oligoribonuclease